MESILLPVKGLTRRMGIYLTKRRNRLVIPWLKGDILDIGCGSAYLANIITEGQRYVGIDVNEEQISLLKHKHVNNLNCGFWCVDVDEDRDISTDVPFLHSTFNIVTLLAVIEHLRNPYGVLRLSHRLLKNEGSLLITTPTQLGDKVSRLITSIQLGTKALPYPHVRIYNLASLTALVEEVGFQVNAYRIVELGMNQLFICSKRFG